MDWFMERINLGCFEVVNPYNRRVSVVPATPDRVHTIVFWSKDFGPFIDKDYGRQLNAMGFNVFINFTINTESSLLEPNVPGLMARLTQLGCLCDRFGAGSVNWRFDPICFFRYGDSDVRDNLGSFETIAREAARLGVSRCITSFMDDYPKIGKRTASIPGFAFVDPPLTTQTRILLWMKGILDSGGIALHTCCEKELLEALPPGHGIRNSACIPNDLLVQLFGGHLSCKRDTGQRIQDGCGCMVSMDIGSYSSHPCYHNCLFCYANPASSGQPTSRKQHSGEH